jgi:hypothetical protein
MANGATVSGLNPDYYLSLAGNENLQIGNFVLSVNTNIARNIYLPKMSSGAKFATGSLHIFIVDITGSAATNNITIYPHPDDKINTGGLGVPLVVNTNSAVVDILSVGNGRWSTANYNGGSGGGGGLTSITYNALVALAGAGNLTVGAFYLITDFQMATYIQFSGGGIGSEEIYTGAIEPMIVQAASASEIGGTIISTVNPTDIINYSLLFNDREWDAVAGQSTGIITYREDTINKNSRDYDFRNIIFRRWETVNGSGNYDSYLDTGNGFADFEPYPTNLCYGNKIGSPLFGSLIFGLPYFLDNTPFFTNDVVGNSIKVAFANTFQGEVSFNTITAVLENIVVNEFKNNLGNIFAINNLADTANKNFFGSITGNVVISINNNTCETIEDNNFTGVITSNVGNAIANNISNAPNANISDNQVKGIGDNSNFTEISNNAGNEISNNALCVITGNIVNQISDNNISQAGLLTIDENNGNLILDNSHTSPTGLVISQNNCNRINNNDFGNTTAVTGNNGNDFVLNNFAGAGIFNSNSFVDFTNNTNNGGDIQKNLFMANITAYTFVPTAGMSGGSASVTIYDSVAGNVEQLLAAGVISYVSF